MKYLNVKIYENFNWKQQISNLSIKLNIANAILSKLRHFIEGKLRKQWIRQYLNLIYIFFFWFGHKIQILLKKLRILKKKSLQLLYFLSRSDNMSHLSKEFLPDKMALKTCLFINKHFNKDLPTNFKNWFTLSSESHALNTRWSNLGCFVAPPYKTKLYGRNLVLPTSLLSIHGIISKN